MLSEAKHPYGLGFPGERDASEDASTLLSTGSQHDTSLVKLRIAALKLNRAKNSHQTNQQTYPESAAITIKRQIRLDDLEHTC